MTSHQKFFQLAKQIVGFLVLSGDPAAVVRIHTDRITIQTRNAHPNAHILHLTRPVGWDRIVRRAAYLAYGFRGYEVPELAHVRWKEVQRRLEIQPIPSPTSPGTFGGQGKPPSYLREEQFVARRVA
jgi:hypothetical protein